MGLFNMLTGGIRDKYKAVQDLADQLGVEEAKYCYKAAHTKLLAYLVDPGTYSGTYGTYGTYGRAGFVEVVVALHERLLGSDPWFHKNKGLFRIALTKVSLSSSVGAGGGYAELSKLMDEFLYTGNVQEFSQEDTERLEMHIQDMLAAGPEFISR